jgi:hypothetical protein
MPWVHEAKRRKQLPEYLSNCDSCMKTQSKQTRQAVGCGWEPADPVVPVRPWSPSNMAPFRQGDVTTCPGYTTNLPALIEVCRARVHWDKNAAAFAAFCEGDATEQTLAALEILDGAINEVSSWAMTPRNEGGGRD